MTHMNDVPPSADEKFFSDDSQEKMAAMCESHAPMGSADGNSVVGHKEKIVNFHHMHNQSQIRSRGYGIGNHVVGLPPHAKDAYYTQPGSPYNDASIRKLEMIGSLDDDGGRAYKSDKWADRLKTEDEKQAEKEKQEADAQQVFEQAGVLSRKQLAMRNRGVGTTISK